jgi:hypothetical protein
MSYAKEGPQVAVWDSHSDWQPQCGHSLGLLPAARNRLEIPASPFWSLSMTFPAVVDSYRNLCHGWRSFGGEVLIGWRDRRSQF